MRAIQVMFDSLNRHILPPYGCNWIHAPNFGNLAERTVVFENCYVGSMPCMPARRELHTGRYNFLHRSWGPLEPFDDSMPELLKNNGVYTHLASDHYHYWEDGGCTYHSRYSSWEAVRGQEGDPWKGEPGFSEIPESLNNTRIGNIGSPSVKQDWINRKYMQEEEDYCIARTFQKGIEFIEKNINQDNWFVDIETFDPHEPFYSHQKYKDIYCHNYKAIHYDWPPYQKVSEDNETIEHIRFEYAALVSMCDNYLGKIIDIMDKYNMWDDTMLIINTDHGYLLSEHGWWAKCIMPFYEEIAHTPLFIWDPRSSVKGERRRSLVQTIDLAPTLLDFFDVEIPKSFNGSSLKNTIAFDKPVRNAALFGIFGGHVNVTNGRYVYMRAPVSNDNTPLFEYTIMPAQHGAGRAFMETERLGKAVLVKPFTFTKNCSLLKIPGKAYEGHNMETLLFDLQEDPIQENPINNIKIEEMMVTHLVRLLKENDAPYEQYIRLGLEDYYNTNKAKENKKQC